MSITENEAIRIREILESVLHKRFGYAYNITTSMPVVRDDIEFKVRFQVAPPRLTPMEQRYLDMCKSTEMRKDWLNKELRFDGKVVLVEGCINGVTGIRVLLRPKLGRGGLGSSEYHLKPGQLVTVMENQ